MRRSTPKIPLLFSLLFACGGAEPEPAPKSGTDSPAEAEKEPALAQPPVGAFVVLDPGARLATTASVDAARIPIAAEQTPMVGRIAEVVGAAGAFIEVRSVAPERGQACAGSFGSEADIELRFFVLRAALQQVLIAPKRVELDDGTKLEFAAGVPVVATGEKAELAVGQARLFTSLAAEDVGRWFTTLASGPFEEQPEGQAVVRFHYGDQTVDGVMPFRLADTMEDIEGGKKATFVNACGSFTLRVDHSDPPMTEAIDANMAEREAKLAALMAGEDPVDCEMQQWVAAVDTAVSWKQGGSPAGTIRREYTLPAGATQSEGKVCFPASGFDLCIETAKLQRKDNLECLAGELGLVGVNPDFVGGSGASGGTGFGGRGKGVPVVKQAKATVSAGLPADIIRRIVRAHINEVRTCYDKGLAASPGLAGTVEIAFTINAKGKVSSSSVKLATLVPANDTLGTCIAKAAKDWTFPKPTGGVTVDVVYPFILEPG